MAKQKSACLTIGKVKNAIDQSALSIKYCSSVACINFV